MSHRFVLFAIPLLALSAADAQEVLVGARDTARPGGVYATAAARDAGACAQFCAGDAICMAWTQRADGQCELKAVITPEIVSVGARSGLSARAPEFARRLATSETALMQLAAVTTAPTEPIATLSEPGLLGGPVEDDGALRPRLGPGRP